MAVRATVSDGMAVGSYCFPILLKSKTDTRVVLFTSEGVGTVVAGNWNGIYSVGYYFDTWNMEFFERFTGTVTLTNE